MDSLKSDVLGSRASTVNRWSDTRTSTSLGPLTQEVRVETKPHKKARTHPENMSTHISLRSDVFTLMHVVNWAEEHCNDRSALWSYEHEIRVNSLIT